MSPRRCWCSSASANNAVCATPALHDASVGMGWPLKGPKLWPLALVAAAGTPRYTKQRSPPGSAPNMCVCVCAVQGEVLRRVLPTVQTRARLVLANFSVANCVQRGALSLSDQCNMSMICAKATVKGRTCRVAMRRHRAMAGIAGTACGGDVQGLCTLCAFAQM